MKAFCVFHSLPYKYFRARVSSGVNTPNSLHLADKCKLRFGWMCWFIHQRLVAKLLNCSSTKVIQICKYLVPLKFRSGDQTVPLIPTSCPNWLG